MISLRSAPSRFTAIACTLWLTCSAAICTASDLMTLLAEAENSDPFYREAQNLALAAAEGIPQARAEL